MKARRGYTLIETLVATALVGAAMSAILLGLRGMYQSDRRARDEAASQFELDRLARQLREDSHQAREPKVEEPRESAGGSQALSLTLPDERVVQYTIDAEGIERILRRGETRLHRESYRLPSSSVAHWQIESEGRLPIVSLVVDSSRADLLRSIDAYRVDAAVGLSSISGPKAAAKREAQP